MEALNILYITVSAVATVITIVVMLASPITKLTSAITKLEVTLAHNMEHTTKHEYRLDTHDRILSEHAKAIGILQSEVNE